MKNRLPKNLDVSTDHHLSIAIDAAIEAGKKILHHYHEGVKTEFKSDNSPLTQADKDAHKSILKKLNSTKMPVLSEEGRLIKYDERKFWEQLWVVDPLDGTKEFLKHNGEFTVNIALIRNQAPVLGVVFYPVKNVVYFGSENLNASYRSDLTDSEKMSKKTLKIPVDQNRKKYRIVASKSHMSQETADFINNLKKQYKNIELVSIGSSLKICLVAEGSADIYPRFAPTFEWDTAAAHAVLKYAGGDIIDASAGQSLKYNKKDLHNPWFIAKKKYG